MSLLADKWNRLYSSQPLVGTFVKLQIYVKYFQQVACFLICISYQLIFLLKQQNVSTLREWSTKQVNQVARPARIDTTTHGLHVTMPGTMNSIFTRSFYIHHNSSKARQLVCLVARRINWKRIQSVLLSKDTFVQLQNWLLVKRHIQLTLSDSRVTWCVAFYVFNTMQHFTNVYILAYVQIHCRVRHYGFSLQLGIVSLFSSSIRRQYHLFPSVS